MYIIYNVTYCIVHFSFYSSTFLKHAFTFRFSKVFPTIAFTMYVSGMRAILVGQYGSWPDTLRTVVVGILA